MGFSNSSGKRDIDNRADEELLTPLTGNEIPKDSFHFAYIIYFTLGVGFLLPWNAFITAVDYFSYLYPDSSVDRVFALVYMPVTLLFLLFVIASTSARHNHQHSSKTSSHLRINVGLVLFMVSLLTIPLMDVFYIKGRPGIYTGYWVTITAVALSGVADALVQGGVIGSAGELPERYMQAVVAGTAVSGVLVSVLRIVTKSMFPQNTYGLRGSAIMYFVVGIIALAICIVFHNVADRLPVIRYYKDLKTQAVNEDKNGQGLLGRSSWRSTLGHVVSRVKWHGFGIVLIYIVTLSIFPGYITEDVHSQILKDWYPILLITGYNVFDLIGKFLTAVYLLKNLKVAVGSCFARLLFYPLFYGCLHGPEFFRTEIPVLILTCILGLSNGYLTSVLMILAPKAVEIQHAETAGIVIVLYLIVGLAAGSVVAWSWVI